MLEQTCISVWEEECIFHCSEWPTIKRICRWTEEGDETMSERMLNMCEVEWNYYVIEAGIEI